MIKAFKNFMSRRTINYKVRNHVMNSFSSFEAFQQTRKQTESERQAANRPHEVLYFHKADDPYSHLTIQCIEKLISSYEITLKFILVGEENLETVHEPSLYNIYCLQDVNRIASFYNIDFQADEYPAKELVEKANSILTAVKPEDCIEIANKVSSALWEGDMSALDKLSSTYLATMAEVKKNLIQGNKIRDAKGYYFGSAFYYEKELYWGVDRLPYLEERLADLGANKAHETENICPLELKAPKQFISDKKVNLYYYPSLNSPYTFVSTKRIRRMQEDYPINLITKPVLPMLMPVSYTHLTLPTILLV